MMLVFGRHKRDCGRAFGPSQGRSPLTILAGRVPNSRSDHEIGIDIPVKGSDLKSSGKKD
jgi:hypothetical protein